MRRRRWAIGTPPWHPPSRRRPGAPDVRSARAGEPSEPLTPGADLARRGRATVARARRLRPCPSPVGRRPKNFREFLVPEDTRPPLDEARAASVVGGGRLHRLGAVLARIGRVLFGGRKERR